MAKCNNNVTVASLPTCDSVSESDYLIVYNSDNTCKVKFEDFVFGAENVDFYPELLEIISTLESLSSVVIPQSASWDDTYNTVFSNSASWESLTSGETVALLDDVASKIDKWDSVSTTMSQNSATWEAAAVQLGDESGRWNRVADEFDTYKSNWNTAYTATLDGFAALNEALALVADQPWWQHINNSSGGGDIDQNQFQSLYTTVYTNSSTWGETGQDISFLTTQINTLNTGVKSVVNSSSADWNSAYTAFDNRSQYWDFAHSKVNAHWTQWNQAYTAVDENQTQWDDTYTRVNDSGDSWDDAATRLADYGDGWDTTHSRVQTYADTWDDAAASISTFETSKNNWDFAYNTIISSRTSWDAAASKISNFSAEWDQTHDIVSDNKNLWTGAYERIRDYADGWDATTTRVNNYADGWDDAVLQIGLWKDKWTDAYTTVTDTSSRWEATYNNVNTNSTNWNSVVSTVQTFSSSWDESAVVDAIGDRVSALELVTQDHTSWSSTHTTVETYSAGWDQTLLIDAVDTRLQAVELSTVNVPDWNSVVSTVQSYSGEWDESVTVDAIDDRVETLESSLSSYLATTGGALSGNLHIDGLVTVSGNISATGDLFVNKDSIVYSDGTTWGSTDSLVSKDVYTSYTSNSAQWDVVANIVNNNETQWNATYTTLIENEIKWNYAHNRILADADNWDSAVLAITANETNWTYAYNTLQNSKSTWDTTASLFNQSAGNWNLAYTAVISGSPDWNNTYQIVDRGADDWDDTKDIVVAKESDWDHAYNTLITNQSKWDSASYMLSSNMSDWNYAHSKIMSSSDEWDDTHDIVNIGHSDWTTTANIVANTKTNWDTAYNTLLSKQTLWDATKDRVSLFGDEWDLTHDIVIAAKDDWNGVVSTVMTNSADWFSPPDLTSLIESNSANWNNAYTAMSTNSAGWNDVKFIVDVNHDDWNTTATHVSHNMSSWNNAYTAMSTNSAGWNDVKTYTQETSATNNSAYNQTVFVNTSGDTITGDLTIDGLLQGNTAVFTSITALSSVVDVIDIKVRELSGYDIIDGNLSVDGDVTVQNHLHIADGGIVFGDSGLSHGHEHTPDGVEILSIQDLREFKSVYTDVNVNSGVWSDTYTTVLTNSSDWFSPPHLTSLLQDNSAYWNDAYSVVTVNSAEWADHTDITDITNTVATNSADWADKTTVGDLTAAFVNIQGDTMTGVLSVVDDIITDNNLHVTHGDIIFGDDVDHHGHIHSPNEIETLSKRNVIDFKDTFNTVLSNSGNWFTPPEILTLLNSNSARWISTHTSVHNTSGDWDNTHATVQATSSDWNNTHASVQTTSGDWNSAHASVQATSGDWDNTHATVQATSGDWDNTHSSVQATSGDWDNTHATVQATSGDWSNTHSSVQATSSNWDSTHSNVSTTSSNWDSVYANVHSTSGDWSSVYSFVNTDSATNNTDYNRTNFVNTSGDTITGDLNITGHIDGSTAMFTSITALSSVVDVIDIKARELSGYDIIDGNLSVDGDTSIKDDLYVTDGDLIFGDNHMVHGFAHTPEEVERLTKYDVRDFKSVYTNVNNTSSRWDDVYTDVSVTSADWNSTHTSVFATSSDWDSVYNFVNAESATNNTTYNRTTFLNVTGDSMSGDLFVEGSIDTDKNIHINFGNITFGDNTRYPPGYEPGWEGIVFFSGVGGWQTHHVGRLVRANIAVPDRGLLVAGEIYTIVEVDLGAGPSNSVAYLETGGIGLGAAGQTTNGTNNQWALLEQPAGIESLTKQNVTDFKDLQTSIVATSASWDSTHASVLATSSNWNDTHASVLANSSNWDSTHANVHSTSGDWNSVHASVLATSSNWDNTHASVLATSSNWDNTHASVLATSSNWNDTHTSVHNTSGDWDSVYNFVASDSATNNTDYNKTTFVNTSGDTIQTLDVVNRITSNEAVFTSLTALSSVVDVIDIKVRELSGYDIIDGDLRVDGDVSARDDLYITDGKIIFGDDHTVHGHVHTPEEIENLTKHDVRDFKSTHASVLSTSANWDDTHTVVLGASSNWNNTHASVLTTSANWDSTHTSVLTTSANWDSVYNFVVSESATNNTGYNHSVFVNASGDTIAGDLVVIDNFKVHGDTHLRGDLIVDGNIWFTSGLLGEGVSINLGDRSTDYVNFVGSVSSDIFPSHGGQFDLGDESKEWNTLHVRDVSASGGAVFEDDLKITSGALIYGDAGLSHGHEHTPENLESLTKQNVRELKSTYATVQATSGDWDNTHATVQATSGDWGSTHTSVSTTSSNWDSTHTSVSTTSSNWDSTHASVLATSSTWDSTHASVQATSSNWDSTHSSVQATSSDWDSTHSSVQATSSNWDSTHSSVQATSGDWSSVYSYVNTDSATNNTDYNRTNFVNTSGDTITGDLTIDGHLQSNTAMFTSITALSSVVDVIDIKVRELSGYDIIDGDLRVDGDITTEILRLSDLHDPLYYIDTGSTYNFTGDDTTKISNKYVYTHAVNVFGQDDHLINGVLFESEQSGTGDNWEITGGMGNALHKEESSTQGVVRDMLNDNFRYLVDQQKIVLKGLTVGKKYAFYMYSQAWSTDNISKTTTITSDASESILSVDQNQYINDTHDGHLVEYIYIADSSTVEIIITPDLDSTWHLYAFANREIWNYDSQTLTSRDLFNHHSTYNTTNSNSAYWSDVYSFVNTDSATNNTHYNHSNFVTVSGDTMTGSLSVKQDLTIDGTSMLSGELFIDGHTTFNNGVTAENNVYIKGDLRVDGNVWLIAGANSVIHVGDSIDDVVVFQAPVDSDIEPYNASEKDLGSITKTWRNIYADAFILQDGTALSGSNFESIYAATNTVTSTSGEWNHAYDQVNILTQETSGLNERVDADYHYSISSFDKAITTLEPSLSDYLQEQFQPGDLDIGDTIIVAATNTVYILINKDPYDVNSWVEINAKPNQLFYKTNIVTGAVIDVIDLNRFKSAKYFIEIENRSGELLVAELSLLSTGQQDKTKLIEHNINYTTDTPFVGFEAVARGDKCELILHENTNYETLWNPGTLSSIPYTWLDAADETKVIVDSSNRFNRWEGSGLTDLYMYSPAGAEPEYITSGEETQNGRNVFKFTNDSDFLESNYHDGSSVGKWNDDPVIWYLVFKPTGIDNFHDYLLWFEQSNGQDLAIGPDDNDEFFGNVWMKNNRIGNGAYPFTNNFSTIDLADQWNIFELEINPKTQTTSMYLNGHDIQKNVPTDYEFPKTSEHMFRLHANWIGSEFTDGYFAEFLVLEDYKRIKTEGYLAWKWGLQDKLPTDHVYKNFPPQANNIVKGNRTNLF